MSELPITLDLAGEWRFKPGESAVWTSIRVPALWESEGFLELDGTAIYERDIELPSCSYATLEFDAVADTCEVWLNSQSVGGHEVGFTPFTIDVSAFVHAGLNELRVLVTDPPVETDEYLASIHGKQGWANGFFPSPPSLYLTTGGIWQGCRTVVHGPVYISDLWCDLEPHLPEVGITLENRRDSDQSVAIVVEGFGEREVVKAEVAPRSTTTIHRRMSAADARLWSPSSPNLHLVSATAGVEGQLSHFRALRVGLRSLKRQGNDYLLNGEPYRMRSALHQGFWPGGLYAVDPDLIELDLTHALDAGLNTLRTHLKAFEPDWLESADRLGMLLHCDLPIGEPAKPEFFKPNSEYGRRCIAAAVEQVRRDRSRPSIVMWTLTNEIGISEKEIPSSDGYRELIAALSEKVRELDPTRPIIENDWLATQEHLVASDIRSPHWYGRATSTFLEDLDERVEKASADDSPLYVTEFGEWGLPSSEDGREFWDQNDDLQALVKESGWEGGHESFALMSQIHQGWADRLHAERLRTSERILGFCLTEWTDVPHELNGLVTLRRHRKASIEAFKPALANVCLVATLDRYSYAKGEPVEVTAYVSNWSGQKLEGGELEIELGREQTSLPVDGLAPGAAARVGSVTLPAADGELQLRLGAHRSFVRLWVVDPAQPGRVRVLGSQELEDVFKERGWLSDEGGVLVVAEDSLDAEGAESLESRVREGERIVVLAQSKYVPFFGAPEAIPQTWGPTPFCFTGKDVWTLPGRTILGLEVFHCAPLEAIPEVKGMVGVLVPPPIRRWGALVTAQTVGKGRIVVCHLRIQKGLLAGNGFDAALLAELTDRALEDSP
jgi:hypothetical protein